MFDEVVPSMLNVTKPDGLPNILLKSFAATLCEPIAHIFNLIINNFNNVSLEIQHIITPTNRCYLGLNRNVRSKILSQWTKTKLYKLLIIFDLLRIWCKSVDDTSMSSEGDLNSSEQCKKKTEN